MRELHREHPPRRPHDISHMRDRRARCSAQIQHARAGTDVDVVEPAQDTGCELGAKGVPDAILGFEGWGVAIHGFGGLGRVVDGDAFFAVDGFAWCQVFGDEEVFFAAAGDEDAGVTVGFLSMLVGEV
jgi:hypothetical protein